MAQEKNRTTRQDFKGLAQSPKGAAAAQQALQYVKTGLPASQNNSFKIGR